MSNILGCKLSFIVGWSSVFLCNIVDCNKSYARTTSFYKKSATTPTNSDNTKSSIHDGLFLGKINSYLNQYGIHFGSNWISETSAVVSGGRKKGINYAHQMTFALDVDWEKLSGFKGFSTHVVALNFTGRSTSYDYIGDSVIQSQEVYIPHQALIRMYVFYAEQKLWNKKLDIKLGRVSTGNEFAASPFACDFISLATCGHPRAVAQQGFPSWPGAVWGMRISYNISPKSYVQLGGFESAPWPQGGRNGWDWDAKYTTGAYIPIEFGYNPDFGRNRLTGYYRIGGGFDTSRFNTWSSYITNSGKTDNRTQFWVMIDQMIYRNDDQKDHGIYILANWGHDSPTTSIIKDSYNIGFINRGFWKKNPDQQFGVMLTYYKVPKGLNRAQQFQKSQGMNNNIVEFPFLNRAPGVQSSAIMLEANYSIPIYKSFTVVPVFQYFHHVAATKNVYPDAAVIALKTNVIF
ncbi:Carbohydrate-selective porin OprB (OprB) (PDB:4GEY) [Commensalibacter communis]|uniref:carbohydrate porin n=1 Tax=Commensalibacter communis TaxID=2972786 RepID=UPI0022FF5B04|nr:carbohydrate porin [Commensalibacter communis]CAI3954615.1 Carbohydrate-selective porin OprB (OprB) (PDB:4GEY) [Commensalibacter communis]CAI3955352.1 Carbohydrate-selective porin OprB (OprB) (PDB:4GEY) [Commensalibacter communis]